MILDTLYFIAGIVIITVVVAMIYEEVQPKFSWFPRVYKTLLGMCIGLYLFFLFTIGAR